ncbi:MAG: hypothetical protein V1794_01175 [Candidatus Glassbacteria bacterium]
MSKIPLLGLGSLKSQYFTGPVAEMLYAANSKTSISVCQVGTKRIPGASRGRKFAPFLHARRNRPKPRPGGTPLALPRLSAKNIYCAKDSSLLLSLKSESCIHPIFTVDAAQPFQTVTRC